MVKEMKQQFISVIHPTDRKQLFFVYTALFAVTLCGVYFVFLWLGRSVLWAKVDGLLQHYDWMIRLKHSVLQLIRGEGFSFWSWDSGLGADTLGVFGGDYFDPFNYIAILFPEKYINIGYTVAVYLRLYVAGLGFLWFGKVVNLKLRSSLWGALAYSFSAWCFLASTKHDSFVTIAVLFVFLMVGVEKVLRRQSPFPFIISVCVFCLRSIYFLYMSALLVCVYLIIYFIKHEEKTLKHFIQFFGRFFLFSMISVCLTLVIIIPYIYTLTHAVKTGSMEITSFHSLKEIVNYISTFASGNEVFQQFSTFTTSALFLIPIVPIIARVFRRRATCAMIMFLCCLVFLFFPVICAVFNGMGYVTGRWCYGMTFFYIWSGLQCFEDFQEDIIKMKRPVFIFLSFLGIWVSVICRVILNVGSEVASIRGLVNIAVGFLAMYIIIKQTKQANRKWNSVLLTAVLVVNFIVVYNVECFPRLSKYIDNYDEYEALDIKMENSSQRAGMEIQDDTFYRIDQADHISSLEVPDGYINTPYRYTHTTANETLLFHTRSIYTYSSMVSDFIYNFNRLLCNNAGYYYRTSIYNNDNRARLDFLAGVKYFLGDNPANYPPTGADEFAGYGFSPFMKSEKGVNILKTDYALGLGCIFDSYITEEEWNSLDYTEREQALMECVVLPTGSQIPSGMAHKDIKNITSGAHQLPYHIINASNVSGRDGSDFKEDDILSKQSFQVKQNNGGFTIKLDGEIADCEIYLMIRDLKRAPFVQKKDTELGGLGKIRNKLNTSQDYGGFSIYAQNGTIDKKAINSIGQIIGFSDITDYTINMGVCNKGSDEIKVRFDHTGVYTFDSIEVVAVPLNSFRESAQKCMDNSLKTDIINDNYVSGHLSTDQANSMLYVSIPYHDGWRAYVDGKETDIQRIDTAYSGVPIAGEGEHKIEFKFRPVGLTVGIFAFVIGVIGCVLIGIWHRKKEKDNI